MLEIEWENTGSHPGLVPCQLCKLGLFNISDPQFLLLQNGADHMYLRQPLENCNMVDKFTLSSQVFLKQWLRVWRHSGVVGGVRVPSPSQGTFHEEGKNMYMWLISARLFSLTLSLSAQATSCHGLLLSTYLFSHPFIKWPIYSTELHLSFSMSLAPGKGRWSRSNQGDQSLAQKNTTLQFAKYF